LSDCTRLASARLRLSATVQQCAYAPKISVRQLLPHLLLELRAGACPLRLRQPPPMSVAIRCARLPLAL
jgi:hypothetical protein